MAKITFDPELMGHIKTIYGDNELDGKALKQIHQTWQQNPDIIRNAARQRRASSSIRQPIQQPMQQPIRPTISPTSVPRTLTLRVQESQGNDLRGISGFGAAFKEARRRGLKQFRWGKGVYGTQLATGATGATSTTSETPTSEPTSPTVTEQPPVVVGQDSVAKKDSVFTGFIEPTSFTPNRLASTRTPTRAVTTSQQPKTSVQATVARYSAQNTVGGDFGINRALRSMGRSIWSGLKDLSNTRESAFGSNQRTYLGPGRTVQGYQQGGTMNNQEELQKAFLAFLIQDAAAQGVQLQSEQDLQAYAEQLGEEGIKAKYQEFMQKMQGGAMARLGAKLEYYRKLKGVCPEGQELVFFKQGGRICKACQKKADMVEKGKKMNPVEEFKSKRKSKIKSDKCGSKMKK